MVAVDLADLIVNDWTSPYREGGRAGWWEVQDRDWIRIRASQGGASAQSSGYDSSGSRLPLPALAPNASRGSMTVPGVS
jgi:hypothetical protein